MAMLFTSKLETKVTVLGQLIFLLVKLIWRQRIYFDNDKGTFAARSRVALEDINIHQERSQSSSGHFE